MFSATAWGSLSSVKWILKLFQLKFPGWHKRPSLGLWLLLSMLLDLDKTGQNTILLPDHPDVIFFSHCWSYCCRPHKMMCSYTFAFGEGWMASRTSHKSAHYLPAAAQAEFISVSSSRAGNPAELLKVTCHLSVKMSCLTEEQEVILRVNCEGHFAFRFLWFVPLCT